MSKQYLADMLKSIATNDMDAAKAHFSKYSTEKTQEILARTDKTEEAEPESTTTDVVEPTTDEPTDDNKE